MALEIRFTRSGHSLLYRGAPVHLGGIYPGTDDLSGNFPAKLAQLTQRKNNFFRQWVIAYWLHKLPGNAYSPFTRDAHGLWNLTVFNEDYFNRLEQLIQAAAAVGVVVQLTLYDATGMKGEGTMADLADRWKMHPWNADRNVHNFIADELKPVGGSPEFFNSPLNAKQQHAQELYIQKVVGRTKAYWNVFYEIMNEPGQGVADPRRVEWANWATGLIHAETGGARMIFYNDHTGVIESGERRGADMNYWYDHRSTLVNYDKLDGVIFHGDPSQISPNDARFKFRTDKIFQVSSDAYDGDRDDYLWNRGAARHAFGNGMPYQAESLAHGAADGIGAAEPTKLVP